MAKKDTSVDLAFNEFDTLVNTFFKEATGSLEDLQKPKDPPQKKQPRARLPYTDNQFRM